MSEANKQLVRRWFEEVWNQKSESTIDAILDPDRKAHGLPQEDSILIGPEDFKTIHRSFCGAFPDLHVTLEDVIAEDDRVAARWKMTGTHLGDHLGIVATGKKVSLSGSTFVIVRDGKFHDGWNHMDMGGLFARLRASES
jgi:steroid delta-isomerase-like uncharacterized protein